MVAVRSLGLSVETCIAVATVSSVGAAWKVVLADRTAPVRDGKDQEATAAEEPENADKRHACPLAESSAN